MSRIITPFYINKLKQSEIELPQSVLGVSGYFSGQAIKPGYGVVREFGMAIENKNLITDLGLDALVGGPNSNFGFSQRMLLGTGNTPPSFSDTSLESFGAAVPYSGVDAAGTVVGPPPYGWRRVVFQSAVGGATGIWTEIGVAGIGNDTLRSRALILDNGGNPVGFPVLADEQFRGMYELRVMIPSADVFDTVTMGANTYDVTTRAFSVGNTSVWDRFMFSLKPFAATNASIPSTMGLQPYTDSALTGAIGSSGQCTVADSAYVTGSHSQESTWRWGSGVAVGNIRRFQLRRDALNFQAEYNPPIPKLTSEQVTVAQRVSWARA